MKLPPRYPAKRRFVDYFNENFHITTSGNFRTQTLIDAILEIGADRILFSTDWPFENIDHASDWFHATSIAEADRVKIGRTNARAACSSSTRPEPWSRSSTHAAPARIVFGAGSLADVVQEISRLGLTRALVLSTPQQKGDAEALSARLGPFAAGVFSNATMHTPVEVTRMRSMPIALPVRIALWRWVAVPPPVSARPLRYARKRRRS